MRAQPAAAVQERFEGRGQLSRARSERKISGDVEEGNEPTLGSLVVISCHPSRLLSRTREKDRGMAALCFQAGNGGVSQHAGCWLSGGVGLFLKCFFFP